MMFTVTSRHADRRGAVAAQVAVSLLAIMGVGAIALEGGIMQSERRRAQAVADTAALAAAAQLFKKWDMSNNSSSSSNGHDDGTASASALAIANANGYTSSNSAITPNTPSQHGIWIPPVTGPYAGKPGYVEVVVQYNQRRYLSAIFGSGTIPIRARAVARGYIGAFDTSILILNPTKNPSLTTNGNVSVTASGKIVVDSSAGKAANITGNSGSIVGSEIDVVGGLSGKTNNFNAPTAGSTSDVFSNNSNNYVDDPLGPNGTNLPAPSLSGLPTRGAGPNAYNAAQNEVLQPGIYAGGISVTQAGVQMASGTYVIEGKTGFSVSTGKATVTSQAGGVLIYLTEDSKGNYAPLSFQANTAVALAPMTTGTYAGITIFQDRNAPVGTSLSFQGGTGTNITGLVYAPNGAVTLSGGNVLQGNNFIVNTMTLSGNNTLNIPNPVTPVKLSRYFGLVE
jgi:hypothetical protein